MDFIIEADKNTPYVRISRDEGEIELIGKSNGENVIKFYKPILDKVKSFRDYDGSLHVNCYFEYFNTSSAKCLLDIFKAIKEVSDTGVKTEITWNYEEDDDDMMETGEDYADLVELEFNLVEIPEDEFQAGLKQVS